MRHPFGAGVADWVFDDGSTDAPVFAGGATLTFYNAKDSGTRYEQLALDAAGTTIVAGITSSNGGDGYRKGQVPLFYGPDDDTTTMWMSADGGERVLISSVDSGALAGQVNAAFAQHVAAQNPHGTSFGSLSDTSFPTTIPAGSVPVWNDTTHLWEVSSATGLNPNSFVKVVGGSIVRIPDGDTTTIGEELRAPSGTRTGNLMQFAYNTGSNGAPVWSLGSYVSPYGELRARATDDARIPFRVERRASGATADLLQVVSEVGAVLAWINSKGLVRAPNLGRSVSFTSTGAVTANPGKFSWWNETGVDLTLRSIRFTLDTAGSTTSTFDVNDNGSTLYPTGKPTLGSGVTTVQLSTSFTILAGHRLTVDVDVAGTGAQNLAAQLELV